MTRAEFMALDHEAKRKACAEHEWAGLDGMSSSEIIDLLMSSTIGGWDEDISIEEMDSFMSTTSGFEDVDD